MNEKNWGGARPGAGRPELGDLPTWTKTIRLPGEMKPRLDAARQGDENDTALIRRLLDERLTQKEPTMKTYTITSKASIDMGHFEGMTPTQALADLHRDAGYDVHYSSLNDEIVFDSEEDAALCGTREDWIITELVAPGHTGPLAKAGFDDHQDDRQGSNVYWHYSGFAGVSIDLDDHNEPTGSFTVVDSEGMPSGTHSDIEDAIRRAESLIDEA